MIASSCGGIVMRIWARFALIAAAPLLLAGCLWGPGKFNSTLALHKNGTFVLDYKGEILMQMPEDKGSAPVSWNDKMLHCYHDGRIEQDQAVMLEAQPDGSMRPLPRPRKPGERECTANELAKGKADHEKNLSEMKSRARNESEQMAKLFGLPGSDEASNRAFAAKLMKYQGWRSVAYKGKGLFDVDYHFEGRTAQDFAFPLMPDSDMVLPFVTIRRRNDGAVLVTAPAFTGGSGPFGVRAKAMGLPDKGDNGPPSRAEGRFTIITDGEVLTNNSEDGPAPHAAGRQVHWDVGTASAKIPEMLVRL
jgi:hypothetical protein